MNGDSDGEYPKQPKTSILDLMYCFVRLCTPPPGSSSPTPGSHPVRKQEYGELIKDKSNGTIPTLFKLTQFETQASNET